MTMKTNLHYQSKLLSTSQIDQLKILLPELGFYSFKHSSELKKQIDENEPELNIVIVDNEYLSTSELFLFPFSFPGLIRYIVAIEIGEEMLIKKLLLTGANGVLHREEPIECFAQCVKEVITNGGCVYPKVIFALNKVWSNINHPLSKLSVREKIIMDHILKGKSDKMVADQLQISYHTAKTHRKNIYKKLNINSQGQLFALLT